ncbi:hypothetical protein FRC01_008970 [Tulasnella sp. 417]|nr:hypothetical protein FRC01_008970 [Tulasnella sp. 417]
MDPYYAPSTSLSGPLGNESQDIGPDIDEMGNDDQEGIVTTSGNSDLFDESEETRSKDQALLDELWGANTESQGTDPVEDPGSQGSQPATPEKLRDDRQEVFGSNMTMPRSLMEHPSVHPGRRSEAEKGTEALEVTSPQAKPSPPALEANNVEGKRTKFC